MILRTSDINDTFIRFCLWYEVKEPMVSRSSGIIACQYHLFLWYHVTCAASWCWLGEPLARSSASSCLTAANELRTGVQLNSDELDPAHGLVAVDAALIASFSQVHWHSQSVRGPGQPGQGSHESLSDWQQPQLYHGSPYSSMSSCTSLHECWYLWHYPIQCHCKSI